jgi:hypothetical protein
MNATTARNGSLPAEVEGDGGYAVEWRRSLRIPRTDTRACRRAQDVNMDSDPVDGAADELNDTDGCRGRRRRTRGRPDDARKVTSVERDAPTLARSTTRAGDVEVGRHGRT